MSEPTSERLTRAWQSKGIESLTLHWGRHLVLLGERGYVALQIAIKPSAAQISDLFWTR